MSESVPNDNSKRAAKPKRHHFLPEFYLKGFARDNLVWVYDREKRQYRHQHVQDTAVIGHYYDAKARTGGTYYGVEEYLSKMENRAKPVITKLEDGEMITPEDRLYFAHFTALLLFRTPKFERQMQQAADAGAKLLMKRMIPSVEAAAAHLRRYGKKGKGLTPESIFAFIHNEEYEAKGDRNTAIDAMFEMTERSTMALACMDWMVAHADERTSFISTDSPLGFFIPAELRGSSKTNLGLLSDQVTKFIPLSQRTALVIGLPGLGFGHCSVDRRQVRDINIAVGKECERFVLGSEENLVRAVVRWSKIDTSNTATRIKVEHIPHPTDPSRTYLVSRLVSADAPEESVNVSVKDGQVQFS